MARDIRDLIASLPADQRARIETRAEELRQEIMAMNEADQGRRETRESDGWTVDDYGYIVNGEETYRSIQMLWRDGQPTTINWSPDPITAHVLLLTPGPVNQDRNGNWAHSFHPALRAEQMMFIGVMHRGCFGFDMFDGHWVSPDYAGEKLNLQGSDARAMADLINGMKTMIAGRPHDPPTFQEQSAETAQPDRQESAFTVKPPA
jgi:hypothetical protein